MDDDTQVNRLAGFSLWISINTNAKFPFEFREYRISVQNNLDLKPFKKKKKHESQMRSRQVRCRLAFILAEKKNHLNNYFIIG